jgi:hypothetical protein
MPFGRRAAPPSLKMGTPRARNANTQGTRTISTFIAELEIGRVRLDLRGLSRCVGGRLRRLLFPSQGRLLFPSQDGKRG